MRKWTSLILTVLIAFQSVVAMADAHQSHQSGSDHVEFKHDHDDGSDESASAIEYPQSNGPVGQFDCHHCCHCHGMSPAFLTAQGFGPTLQLSNHSDGNYSVEYPSLSISPDLRPPIV
jgi:hypothetical protein